MDSKFYSFRTIMRSKFPLNPAPIAGASAHTPVNSLLTGWSCSTMDRVLASHPAAPAFPEIFPRKNVLMKKLLMLLMLIGSAAV